MDTWISDPNTIAKLLKPSEVAALLGVSKSFIYHLLQTGVIPVVRLGRTCRIRPQDLVEYIEKNIHNSAEDF
jgi:excisionase family DNA binding protein